MNRIKAVIFDHGGTLAESYIKWHDYITATKNLLHRHGYEVETPHLSEAVNETIEHRIKIRKELRKELNPEEFFTKILKIMEIPSSESIIEDLIADFYIYYSNVYPDCLTKLLEDLSRSYKIALLSNAWNDGPRKSLEIHGYSKWFDVMVCSCDIGVPKPDPRIFRYILRKLGLQANEAVMVGDSIETDLWGAKAVGITPVWIENMGPERWDGYSIKSVCELPKILVDIQEST